MERRSTHGVQLEEGAGSPQAGEEVVASTNPIGPDPINGEEESMPYSLKKVRVVPKPAGK